MIDTKTGEIAIDGLPMKIGPKFTRRDLPSLGIEVKSQIVNEPHHSYSLGKQTIGDEMFSIVLFFFEERLQAISLFLFSEKFGTSWDDWSEEKEQMRKAAHNAWLIKQTGRAAHKYPWGEVSSTYDPRSGSSSITIRYSEIE